MSKTPPYDQGKKAIEDIIFNSKTISEKENRLEFHLHSKNELLDCEILKNTFEESIINYDKLIISFSHDNYLENNGGIQKCIKTEEEAVHLEGISYLHIFPKIARTWLVNDNLAAELPLGINLNGKNIGTTIADNLIRALKTLPVNEADSIIHSPLGLNLRSIIDIGTSLQCQVKWYFWIHDYTTLCPNFNLLRNNVIFCGAPVSNSKQCENCNAGYDRINQAKEFKDFFDEIKPVVISPSDFTKQFWLDKSKLPYHSIRVIPHYTLGEEHKCRIDKTNQNLKIAFVGTPVYHKGWNDFIDLISAFNEKPSPFSFYVFASYAPRSKQYNFVKVVTNAEETAQMRDQLIKHDIDIAFIGSLWPETFCLTTYEAIAADTFVVTNYLSGNAAKVVREQSHGYVYRGIPDLVEYLKDSENYRTIIDRRLNKKYRSLILSKMTYTNT